MQFCLFSIYDISSSFRQLITCLGTQKALFIANTTVLASLLDMWLNHEVSEMNCMKGSFRKMEFMTEIGIATGLAL